MMRDSRSSLLVGSVALLLCAAASLAGCWVGPAGADEGVSEIQDGLDARDPSETESADDGGGGGGLGSRNGQDDAVSSRNVPWHDPSDPVTLRASNVQDPTPVPWVPPSPDKDSDSSAQPDNNR